jgi:hypothetical protein
MFEYLAAQTETDIETAEYEVYLNDGTYEAYSTIGPASGVADLLDAALEGAYTMGDILRGMWAILAGKVTDYSSGTYSYLDPTTGAITRVTFTADETGRVVVTIGDLSGP